MIMALLKKIFRGSKWIDMMPSFLKKSKTWKDIEYFDENWKDRIKTMVVYIDKNKTVMDLGCGKMWLVEYLPEGCTYIPVDYIKRNQETIVADFNKKEYPDIKSDIAFISGCLEYLDDYRWFLSTVALHSNQVILSYCSTDHYPDIRERKNNFWVNNLSTKQVIGIFASFSYHLQHSSLFNESTSIFVFSK